MPFLRRGIGVRPGAGGTPASTNDAYPTTGVSTTQFKVYAVPVPVGFEALYPSNPPGEDGKVWAYFADGANAADVSTPAGLKAAIDSGHLTPLVTASGTTVASDAYPAPAESTEAKVYAIDVPADFSAQYPTGFPPAVDGAKWLFLSDGANAVDISTGAALKAAIDSGHLTSMQAVVEDSSDIYPASGPTRAGRVYVTTVPAGFEDAYGEDKAPGIDGQRWLYESDGANAVSISSAENLKAAIDSGHLMPVASEDSVAVPADRQLFDPALGTPRHNFNILPHGKSITYRPINHESQTLVQINIDGASFTEQWFWDDVRQAMRRTDGPNIFSIFGFQEVRIWEEWDPTLPFQKKWHSYYEIRNVAKPFDFNILPYPAVGGTTVGNQYYLVVAPAGYEATYTGASRPRYFDGVEWVVNVRASKVGPAVDLSTAAAFRDAVNNSNITGKQPLSYLTGTVMGGAAARIGTANETAPADPNYAVPATWSPEALVGVSRAEAENMLIHVDDYTAANATVVRPKQVIIIGKGTNIAAVYIHHGAADATFSTVDTGNFTKLWSRVGTYGYDTIAEAVGISFPDAANVIIGASGGQWRNVSGAFAVFTADPSSDPNWSRVDNPADNVRFLSSAVAATGQSFPAGTVLMCTNGDGVFENTSGATAEFTGDADANYARIATITFSGVIPIANMALAVGNTYAAGATLEIGDGGGVWISIAAVPSVFNGARDANWSRVDGSLKEHNAAPWQPSTAYEVGNLVTASRISDGQLTLFSWDDSAANAGTPTDGTSGALFDATEQARWIEVGEAAVHLEVLQSVDVWVQGYVSSFTIANNLVLVDAAGDDYDSATDWAIIADTTGGLGDGRLLGSNSFNPPINGNRAITLRYVGPATRRGLSAVRATFRSPEASTGFTTVKVKYFSGVSETYTRPGSFNTGNGQAGLTTMALPTVFDFITDPGGSSANASVRVFDGLGDVDNETFVDGESIVVLDDYWHGRGHYIWVFAEGATAGDYEISNNSSGFFNRAGERTLPLVLDEDGGAHASAIFNRENQGGLTQDIDPSYELYLLRRHANSTATQSFDSGVTYVIAADDFDWHMFRRVSPTVVEYLGAPFSASGSSVATAGSFHGKFTTLGTFTSTEEPTSLLIAKQPDNQTFRLSGGHEYVIHMAFSKNDNSTYVRIDGVEDAVVVVSAGNGGGSNWKGGNSFVHRVRVPVGQTRDYTFVIASNSNPGGLTGSVDIEVQTPLEVGYVFDTQVADATNEYLRHVTNIDAATPVADTFTPTHSGAYVFHLMAGYTGGLSNWIDVGTVPGGATVFSNVGNRIAQTPSGPTETQSLIAELDLVAGTPYHITHKTGGGGIDATHTLNIRRKGALVTAGSTPLVFEMTGNGSGASSSNVQNFPIPKPGTYAWEILQYQVYSSNFDGRSSRTLEVSSAASGGGTHYVDQYCIRTSVNTGTVYDLASFNDNPGNAPYTGICTFPEGGGNLYLYSGSNTGNFRASENMTIRFTEIV